MKKVELVENSWHFKIYSKFISDQKPKTLCPYFWTWVAIILFAPFVLAMWPIVIVATKIVEYFEKKNDKLSYPEWKRKRDRKAKRQAWWDKFWKVMGIMASRFVRYIILPIAGIGLVYSLYRSIGTVNWGEVLVRIVAVIVISAVIILIIQGLALLYNKSYRAYIAPFFKAINPFNWKITKLIGTMIVATYKKACPIIEWK